MLTIHQVWTPGDDRTLHRLLDIVAESGGSIERTVLGHMDRTGAAPDMQLSLLERGVTIEYDIFGYENMHARWDREPPQDVQRIRDFKRLIDAGFRDQLVVAQDICFKTMMVRVRRLGLRPHPAPGRAGVPRARRHEADLDAILVRNSGAAADVRGTGRSA